MCKGLWDRHGVNNANCYEGIYGEKLLRRPKNDFLENSALFCSRLSEKDSSNVDTWAV